MFNNQNITTMKKILTLCAALLALSTASFAQDAKKRPEFTPEQRAQFRAEKMANQLMLSDADAAQFVPIYKTYILDRKAVAEKFKFEGKCAEKKSALVSNEDVDARVKNDFARKRAMLDLREDYYGKFTTVLSPKQVCKVYELEKEMHAGQAGIHHGNHPQVKPNCGHFDGNRPAFNPQNARRHGA